MFVAVREDLFTPVLTVLGVVLGWTIVPAFHTGPGELVPSTSTQGQLGHLLIS